uniref:NADH dehydrogenase subunit 4L n=2 Tax=unclassified Trichuris TaxID=2603576 RepID=A0A8F5DQ53_9BILA|nr:NADH dehydrogenase subunit 4L [Trichuris sp. ETH392]QXJ80340.1 NADH dehydrogenase subunit 4L [Trichuris sp. ETH232]
MNLDLLLFFSGVIKIVFSYKHLLSIFISLELISLSLISMTWSFIWTQTMWFMIISVIHSVIGTLLLLLMMRQMGNDKTTNLM